MEKVPNQQANSSIQLKTPNEDLEKPWHALHGGCSTSAKPTGPPCNGKLSEVSQETKHRETWVPLLQGSYNPSRANNLKLDANILRETYSPHTLTGADHQ